MIYNEASCRMALGLPGRFHLLWKDHGVGQGRLDLTPIHTSLPFRVFRVFRGSTKLGTLAELWHSDEERFDDVIG